MLFKITTAAFYCNVLFLFFFSFFSKKERKKTYNAACDRKNTCSGFRKKCYVTDSSMQEFTLGPIFSNDQ